MFVYEVSACGFESRCSHLNFRFCACFEERVPWYSGNTTAECGFTLKHVRDMIRTYSQIHCTDKCPQPCTIVCKGWLNGWLFVYELSCCRLESRCSNLNFRFRVCFEEGVPWHSGSYRVWIHSETRTWRDKNVQLIGP